MSNKAVIDTETGGFDPNAGIVEIAMIIVDENLKELKRFSRIINRYFIEGTEELSKYSDKAIEIHGITADMQADNGVTPQVAVIEMEAIFQDYNVKEFIGHNLKKFDIPRLIKFFNQFSKYKSDDRFPTLTDTMDIAKEGFSCESYSLKNLCKVFHITNDNPHRALADCDATLKLLIEMNHAG